MSEGGVDLSQIRGDWKFHMDYLQNAIDKTIQRQEKYWSELGDDAQIGAAVDQQSSIWAGLRENQNEKGTISTTDGQMEAFIDACRGAKGLCDAYEDKIDSEIVEEFTEACRQLRALCDDLILLKEQRPDDQ